MPGSVPARTVQESPPIDVAGTRTNKRGPTEPLRPVILSTLPANEAPEVTEESNRVTGKKKKVSGNPKTQIRRRAWVFTEQSLSEESKIGRCKSEGLAVFDGTVRYICFQLECGEGGKEHFQGYVEFNRSVRLTDVRRIVSDTAHWEPRRGTAAQARNYCQKDDTRVEGPWEHGSHSGGSGERTDLIAFRDAIKEGENKENLYESHPALMARYPRFYNSLKMIKRPKRTDDFVVTLIYGDPGVGKTKFIWDKWEDAEGGFWQLPVVTSQLWFDTYDGQMHVLMDDFAGSKSRVSLSTTLQVLDRYPIMVPIKGGFVWWNPRRIAVTTNVHPDNWFDWKDRTSSYAALRRRFHIVYVWLEGQDVPQKANKDFMTLY